MSDRRQTFIENAGTSAPPKLRDVSSAFAKAFDKWMALQAESARLHEMDPKNPDVYEQEFGFGDLKRLEGLRRARIRQLDGSSQCGFMDGEIKRQKIELDRIRVEASALVVRKAEPAYDRHVLAIADAVRQALTAIQRHDDFLKPLEADGVLIGSLVGRGGPEGELVRSLENFLRNHARETK